MIKLVVYICTAFKSTVVGLHMHMYSIALELPLRKYDFITSEILKVYVISLLHVKPVQDVPVTILT